MTRSTKYPQEIRERAVRMVFEPEHPSQWATIRSVSSKFGMSAETLRSWVRQVERDQGRRPGLSTSEHEDMKRLEREVKELRRANEILKSASAFFAAELDRHPRDDHLHRGEQGKVRGRADLQAPADRPVDLLRGEVPNTFGQGGCGTSG
jgi:transposase